MVRLTRRQLLGASAAAAASLELLPPALRTAPAQEQSNTRGGLERIEHVVFFIQENRSFDTYFGTLSGVRGFDDPSAIRLATGRSVFYQPDPVNLPDGYTLPFHMDTTKTSAAAVPGTSHAWTVQHFSWNGGQMDGWLPTHRNSDGGPQTMGYYERQDLPFHYTLADAFTICDHYHCSAFGPTNPNRLYSVTGTSDADGKNGGPVVDNSESPPYTWTTYPERLQAAGISWRVYQEADNYDDNPLAWFKQFQQASTSSPLFTNGMTVRSHSAFADDVKANRLPQVSWIVAPSVASEHPSYLPAAGAEYTYELLQALASNLDVWSKTVFFLTYDENDGFFDHVPPPTAPPGTPGEWIPLNVLPTAAGGISGPYGLGFRVPMIVISPWSRGGWVSSEVFDHTSMLGFLEARSGVHEPNISAWRRQTVGDLTSTLRFDAFQPTFPGLPDPAPLLTLEQQEVANNPAASVPYPQVIPHQEPGSRPHTPVVPLAAVG